MPVSWCAVPVTFGCLAMSRDQRLSIRLAILLLLQTGEYYSSMDLALWQVPMPRHSGAEELPPGYVQRSQVARRLGQKMKTIPPLRFDVVLNLEAHGSRNLLLTVLLAVLLPLDIGR
jgi:hypothetical protein